MAGHKLGENHGQHPAISNPAPRTPILANMLKNDALHDFSRGSLADDPVELESFLADAQNRYEGEIFTRSRIALSIALRDSNQAESLRMFFQYHPVTMSTVRSSSKVP